MKNLLVNKNLLIILFSCLAFTSYGRLKPNVRNALFVASIHKGTTKADVKDVIGKPDRITEDSFSVSWIYGEWTDTTGVDSGGEYISITWDKVTGQLKDALYHGTGVRRTGIFSRIGNIENRAHRLKLHKTTPRKAVNLIGTPTEMFTDGDNTIIKYKLEEWYLHTRFDDGLLVKESSGDTF